MIPTLYNLRELLKNDPEALKKLEADLDAMLKGKTDDVYKPKLTDEEKKRLGR